MIEVKCSIGWDSYCQEGIVTDITDMNGEVLKTGDIVEVLVRSYHEAGIEDCVVCKGMMIVFDEKERFIPTDKFYVEGWLGADWNDEYEYIIRKVDADRYTAESNYRIV